MSIDDKMLVENAALKEKVSALIAERESLVVLNASLAEKNNILLARLRQHIYELSPEGSDEGFEAWAHELQADSTLACAHINDNNREEEEQWEHMMEEAAAARATVEGQGRARAEEWAAIKKNTRSVQDIYDNNREREETILARLRRLRDLER